MTKKVLINVEDKDIRVAILEEGELSQLFVEPLGEKSIVGNIYKGRVESIVPGLQAVFVDIGLDRNAFLHFGDVQREYSLPHKGPAKHAGNDAAQQNKTADTEEEPIEEPSAATRKGGKQRRVELKPGAEILVQVSKEPLGSKGARVTTYVSLPGRYLVLLPFSSSDGGGVSRRIEDGVERKRLRGILKALKADEGSFIIRTAGLEHDESEIRSDVNKLKKIWMRIRRSAAQKGAPSLVHDEHDILGRLVRDEFTDDIDELLIDSKTHGATLKRILGSTMPDLSKKAKISESYEENIFDRYEVEKQFQKALRNRVWLKSGGYVVIEEVEAMIAIDVNTGKYVGKGDQEETIFKTNLEAAETIARQLRLRDVGGLIVIDFIDMRGRENQQALVRRFKELLKKDRAKTTVSALSEYGLLQMTRKRVRQSLSKSVFRQCPYCQGSGRVLSESQIWKGIKYEMLRVLKSNPKAKGLCVTVHPQMRQYLEDQMLEAAKSIANFGQVSLTFEENQEFHLEQYRVITSL